MIGTVFRVLWRILVGAIAIAAAYATTMFVYPYLDDHVPAFFAIALIYVIAAYLVIPFIVRMWRFVIKPNHLPVYTTSRDGWSCDPVNLVIICKNHNHLIKTMRRAGWQVADPITLTSALRMGYATILGRPYPTAPFGSLFLFGRKQDIGFQIQTGNPPTPRHRHHIRFWQLDTTEEDDKHEHESFWESILHLFVRRERQQVWVGAATYDSQPFALTLQTLQVTHGIDPDTQKERDFVISTLKKQHLVHKTQVFDTGMALTFKGQTVGTRIVVDGKITAVVVR